MGWTLRLVFVCIDTLRWCAKRVPALLGLAVLLVVGTLGWQLLPPYVQHYRFRDDVVELAAASTDDDGRVHGAILLAARRRRIPLHEDRLEVRLQDHERTVRCRYEVPVTLVPRWAPQLLRFSIEVVQPAFPRERYGPPQ